MEEQWNMDHLERMEGDPLKPLRAIFIDLFGNKYSRYIIALTLSFHIPLWSIQFYYLSVDFSVEFLVLYGPPSLIFLYAFVSVISMVYLNDKVTGYLKVLKSICWSLDTCSEGLKKKILQQASYMNYVSAGNIVIGLITYGFAIIGINSHYTDVYYQTVFIKQQFPDAAFILLQIFGGSLIVFILPMMAIVHLEAYFLMHVIFQIKILCERVRKITYPYEDNTELISNDKFQKQVFDRLRFCIRRSGELQRFNALASDVAPKIVVLYIVLCMLLLFRFLGGYYLNEDKYVPLLIAIVVVSCYACLIGFEVGQMLEEECLIFYYEITFLPWYTFNTKNRKMVLFILLHAKTPARLSPYEMFPLSRKSIVQLYKVFTTLSAFLAKTRDGLSL